jgi:AraC-like DNA-binding protein
VNLLFYINLILSVNLFLVAVILLFLKKGNISANKLFGIILCLLSYLNIILSFYVLKWPFKTFPYLSGTHIPVEFSLLPLLFLYFKALFENKFVFNKLKWLHFIPALYFTINSIPYYLEPVETKLKYIYSPEVYKSHYFFATVLYIQFAVYIFLILRMLIRYSRKLNIRDEYTDAIKKWIRELIIFVILLVLGNIIPVFLAPKNLLITTISISSFYFLILYKIFFHSEVFLELQTTKQVIIDLKKYPNNFLTATEEDEIYEKLMTHISTEKSYLDSNITLPELAVRMQVSYHQLSRLINQKFKQNFNDFINSKRIAEAKVKLLDANFNYLTIDAIAQSVGFNSKAAFYNAFKKIENCTPSEFKKQKKIT